jgi:hypothetical protein
VCVFAAGESGRRLRSFVPSVRRTRREAGQSVVEFALVIPILLIIFLGIADFGRVFNAGVVLEAAARDAAEHAAQLYLADPPGNPLQTPAERLSAPVGTADSAYYTAIRGDAARVACAEMKGLTNTDYAGGTCATWPVIAVCVHDQADPNCGATAPGFATVPADCGDLINGWSNASGGSGERWVEVRICYRFTTILDLPIINFGDIYLQRSRSFTVPCYFATGFGGCG